MDRIIQITNKYGLILILLLAFCLRVAWISKSPPSLNWDEASFGYNAYSILKTGKDEFGVKLPIFLRSFDDYKPALYSYLTIPFIYLLGLNEASVRLVSVFSGTFSVIFIYLLAKELFKNKYIGLLSALSIAIEPWAIHFSRAAFEANLALTLVLGGIYFLLKSKLKDNYVVLGTLLLSLSLYAYTASRILIIPILLVFLAIYGKNLFKIRKTLYLIIIFNLILVLPIIITNIVHPETLFRLSSTFLISSSTPARFLSYFSPINLFVRGSSEPTQHIPNFGMFFSFEFFFWVIGIYFLLKKYTKEKILIFLILVAPIPAAITWNWFYPARVLPLFSLFSILIGLGSYQTIIYLATKPKIIFAFSILAIAFLTLYNLANLVTTLRYLLPYEDRGNWQYGMREIVQEIAKNESNYNTIVFETRNAQPFIFVLFYSKYPPDMYQKQIENTAKLQIPRKSFDFGKYIFRDVYWPNDKKDQRTLLVAPDSSLPLDKVKSNSNLNLIKEVNDFEGNLLARIVGLR
ncbi:MAG TPA: glycosyltransferase family 39 protein [Patescibacteria group bacterium]